MYDSIFFGWPLKIGHLLNHYQAVMRKDPLKIWSICQFYCENLVHAFALQNKRFATLWSIGGYLDNGSAKIPIICPCHCPNLFWMVV